MNITNITPYIEQKSKESYPEELLKDMKLISFSGNEIPFGSFIYRMQKYYGDIDLLENFIDCCTTADVVNKFIKALHRVVRNILSSKLHYFSEFKAGIDYRYDIDIGKLRNGIYLINTKLLKISEKLFNNSLLEEEEYDQIRNIIINNINNGDSYDIIYNIFRNHRILRWTANEILQGYIKQNGMIKTLYESLFDETAVKIDVLTLYNGRFIEMTNFVGLTLINGNNIKHINVDLTENQNIQKYLPIEIEKLYFSNYYYSPFKMAKRIYSLSRNKKDIGSLKKIIPLVSGDISLLYQIKSEIDVIILILKKVKNPPIKTINKELDQLKARTTNVLELSDEVLKKLYKLIDNAIKSKNKLYILEDLSDNFLKPIINFFTIEELIKIGFNPPPLYLLPPKLSYEIITRSPTSNPHI